MSKILSKPYDSLTEYISLSNNGNGLFFEQTEFEFPWEFPYYDKKYATFLIDEGSVISLVNHEEDGPYDMYLFNNVWTRYYLDPNSDYRYGSSSPSNVCFEWRNVGSWTTISDNIGDRGFATFKTCLWENGDIDIHIDKLEFDTTLFDSIFTVPGLAGVVTSIALTNPSSRDKAIILSYDPNDPVILKEWNFDDLSNPPFIKILPKNNLKIRFSLDKSSTTSNENEKKLVKVSSIVHSNINIPEASNYKSYTIYNFSGTMIKTGMCAPEIEVQSFPSGLYYLLLNDGREIFKHKFVKI